MRFASREAAGRELGQYLAARGIEAEMVAGLPRGGVVVAAEIARVLQLPLRALVVRKIGHPRVREFAVGALAESDVVVLDDSSFGARRAELDGIIADERERLRDYQTRFHQPGERALAGGCVLIADDGLATGATAEAAVLSARKQQAGMVIFAVPVASAEGMARLQTVADEVVALEVDSGFSAVGQYYDDFPQTTDHEVVALLKQHA